MCESIKHTIHSRKVVVPVPMQILISMGWFPIHCYGQGSILFRYDKSIQKENGSTWYCLLSGKLDTRVHGVNVLQKMVSMHFLDDKGIMHIPSPDSGGVGRC